MKIKLILVGKTDFNFIQEACNEYIQRINRYIPFEIITLQGIKNIKSLPIEVQKEKEAEQLLKYIQNTDYCILLDEKGKEYSSVEFAKYINKHIDMSIKNIIFCVGGPYGFSKEVYEKAHDKIALSKLTFSHQLVRIIFLEQLYRAFTIIKNEPYHH